MPESGLLQTGTPAVHQGLEVARVRALPASSASIADGELVYLNAGRISAVTTGSTIGASFLGVSNDASPTYGFYGEIINPACTVLVGGIAQLPADSATYQIGQAVYLSATTAGNISGTPNGTSIGKITSPFGTAQGADFYANAVTSAYVQLAHPALTV